MRGFVGQIESFCYVTIFLDVFCLKCSNTVSNHKHLKKNFKTTFFCEQTVVSLWQGSKRHNLYFKMIKIDSNQSCSIITIEQKVPLTVCGNNNAKKRFNIFWLYWKCFCGTVENAKRDLLSCCLGTKTLLAL